ncbi:COBW domain-containing protein 1 [Podochytrium sp. JEL0797]|nr:COBW domain-containing protein 1 [Podochytrium sp. JEL0797]
MFWLDDAVQSDIYLDGIITVVDSKYAPLHLTEVKDDGSVNECIKQIAMSDRIVINKTDLVDAEQLAQLERDIVGINSAAIRTHSVKANVPIDFIFDLHAFDDREKGWFDELPSLEEKDADDCHDEACTHHDHTHAHDEEESSKHAEKQHKKHKVDESVKTIMFTVPPTAIVSMPRLETWLQQVLWSKTIPTPPTSTPSTTSQPLIPPQVIRLKALLHTGSRRKTVIQAVHELYDKFEAGVWKDGEECVGKVVLIGRALDRESVKESFEAWCL